jgi:nucleoside-diphosphate-sugar epimerase
MTASSPEPGKQAVVTGGAGFLGSHLCERLVARGIRVACVDNFIRRCTWRRCAAARLRSALPIRRLGPGSRWR